MYWLRVDAYNQFMSSPVEKSDQGVSGSRKGFSSARDRFTQPLGDSLGKKPDKITKPKERTPIDPDRIVYMDYQGGEKDNSLNLTLEVTNAGFFEVTTYSPKTPISIVSQSGYNPIEEGKPVVLGNDTSLKIGQTIYRASSRKSGYLLRAEKLPKEKGNHSYSLSDNEYLMLTESGTTRLEVLNEFNKLVDEGRVKALISFKADKGTELIVKGEVVAYVNGEDVTSKTDKTIPLDNNDVVQIGSNVFRVEDSNQFVTVSESDYVIPPRITIKKNEAIRLTSRLNQEPSVPLAVHALTLEPENPPSKAVKKAPGKTKVEAERKVSLHRPLKEFIKPRGYKEIVALGATVLRFVNPALGLLMAGGNAAYIAFKESRTTKRISEQVKTLMGQKRTDEAVKQLEALGVRADELDLVFDPEAAKFSLFSKKGWRMRFLLDKLYGRQTTLGKALDKSGYSETERKSVMVIGLAGAGIALTIGEVFRQQLPVGKNVTEMLMSSFFARRMLVGVSQYFAPRMAALVGEKIVFRGQENTPANQQKLKGWLGKTVNLIQFATSTYYMGSILVPAAVEAASEVGPVFGQAGQIGSHYLSELSRGTEAPAMEPAAAVATATATAVGLEATQPVVPPTEMPTPTIEPTSDIDWHPGETANLDQDLQTAHDNGWVVERGDAAYYYLDNIAGPDVVVQTINDGGQTLQIEYVKNIDGNFWRDFNGDGVLDQAVYATDQLVPPDLENISGGHLERPALNPEMGEPLPLTVDLDGDGRTEIIQGPDGKYYFDSNNDNQINTTIDVQVENEPQVTPTATGYQIDQLELSNGSVWQNLQVDFVGDGGSVMVSGAIDYADGSHWDFSPNPEAADRPVITGKLANGQMLSMNRDINSADLARYQYELSRLHPEWSPDAVGKAAFLAQRDGVDVNALAGVAPPIKTPETSAVTDKSSFWQHNQDGELVGVVHHTQVLRTDASGGWEGVIQGQVIHELGENVRDLMTPDTLGGIAVRARIAAGINSVAPISEASFSSLSPTQQNLVHYTFNREVMELYLNRDLMANLPDNMTYAQARDLLSEYFAHADIPKDHFLAKIDNDDFEEWLKNIKHINIDLD